MNYRIRALLTCCLAVIPVVLSAQTPCQWNETQTTQVSVPCPVAVNTTTPWTGLHLRGAGQSSSNPTFTSASAAQNGATLFLQDTTPAGGAGGMVMFGSTAGAWASIKGFLTDGSNNTLGHLSFATRNVSSDSFLTERMRITYDGRVAMGTPTPIPQGTLHVFRNNPNETAFWAIFDATISQSSAISGRAEVISATQNVLAGITNTSGLTGAQMQALNTGAGQLGTTTGLALYSGNTGAGVVTNATGAFISVGGGSIGAGYGIWLQDVVATTGYAIYQTGANDVNYFAGKVGIGTAAPTVALDVTGSARVTGDLTVTGNIAAKYQDVAEWVPAVEDLSPGTVVVLDRVLENTVAMSRTSYDTTVAGVVSAQPGVILGIADASKEQIATTGRVKVRADARLAPIAIGDLLVTSDTPGMVMKSRPVDVGGIALHRPGTIVGKALEALPTGQGEILVLLSLQ